MLTGIYFLFNPSKVFAATFNPNNIIDDSVFTNTTTMNAAYINSFLNQFPNSCISSNNGFSAPEPIGYNPTNGFLFGSNVSAGQIIYDASQAYGINPQVLLVTLQKEQSLVDGGGGCSTLNYAAAAGYGCPDSGTTYSYSGIDLYSINGNEVTSVSGTCVNTSLKVGFSQQVIRAAWLLMFGEQRSQGNVNWAIINGNWNNSDDPQSCYSGPMTQGTWQICPNSSSVYYDGFTTIDGTSVQMTNGATAALYWYTPHFSGNQNFYNIFSSWFGSTQFSFSIIQSSGSSAIYLTFNGMKQLISNMNTFNAWGLNNYTTQTISQSVIDAMPTYTSPLTQYVNPYGNSTFYVDSQTFYAVSTNMFAQWGSFNWQAISAVYPEFMGILNNGGALSGFVQTPGNSAIYLMDSGILRSFNSYSIFSSWIPSNTNVINISSTLFNEYPQGTTINGNLISNSGTNYLISNSNAYTLTAAELSSLPSSWTSQTISSRTLASQSIEPFSYFVTVSGDPGIYMLDGGQKRAFANYQLYTQFSRSSNYYTISLNPNISSLITTGTAINKSFFGYNGTYGAQDSNGNALCFNINTTESYTLSSISIALNNQNTLNFLLSHGCTQAAQYIKVDNGYAIYAVSNGTLLPIPDLNTLFNFDPSGNITSLSPTDASQLTMSSLALSNYITNGSADYFVNNGDSYSVSSTVASSWKFAPAVQIGSGLLGSLNASSTGLSNNVVVGGAYYLVDNGNYYSSPTTNTTMLWGLINNVVSLQKSAFSGLNYAGAVTRLIQSQSTSSPYSGILYTIDSGKLIGIPSMEVLANLGNLGSSIKLSDQELNILGAQTAPTLNDYLIKDSTGYYVFDSGFKHFIPQTLESNWIGTQTPTQVSTYFTDSLSNANALTGSIYTPGNPVFYYMNNGNKIGFSNYSDYLSSTYAPASIIGSPLMTLIPN